MASNPRNKADKHFAASQKKADQVLRDKEKARTERAVKTARLRELRLAKEAQEKSAED